jgi:hypothetical protein
MQTEEIAKLVYVCIYLQISIVYVLKLDYNISVNEMFVDFKKLKPVIELGEEYCVLL